MLGWLKDKAQTGRAALTTEVAKFRNRKFMDACTAGCALIAASDGKVTSDEKQKMAGFIQRSDALKIFETRDVIDSFNKAVGDLEFDFQIGKEAALSTIKKVKDSDEQARLLVRLVIAIGASDGNFDEKEQGVAREICLALGLNPSEFDL